MKSRLIIAVLFLIAISANAQLTVTENGNVIIADETTENVNLHVGDNAYINISGKIGAWSTVNIPTVGTNIAVVGEAVSRTPTAGVKNIGVCGIAGNGNSGYDYGTIGVLATNTNGAGIYGGICTSYSAPPVPCLTGTYAGYFSGTTKVNGSVFANNLLSTSDLNLKENITPLSENSGRSALENVLDMNVVKYNFKYNDDKELDASENEVYAAYVKEERERQHFGLIAQELKTIYPNLVVKGQDGYLSINYVELVPVLIQSIQDLKKELDEVKDSKAMEARHITAGVENADEVHTSRLFQNTPNPFKESTTIRFLLAENVENASICIFDMQGKMLKKYELSTSDEQLTINASELGDGMYLYSLIADGKEIDTKRMILTK